MTIEKANKKAGKQRLRIFV